MYECIPDELREMNQWVAWIRRVDGTAVKKMPLDPKVMRSASVTDPRTWSTFDAACRRAGSSGIGFVLTPDDGLVGIDLDGCVTNGVLSEMASRAVAYFESYTELSPSGTGLHIFIKARLESAWKRSDGRRSVEIYGEGRYLTMTGNHLDGTPTEINDRQDELSAFLARNPRPSSSPRLRAVSVPTRTDEEVLQCAAAARNGEKFCRLWRGDTSLYGGDHSRADLALCNLLWYWSGDEAQVDRLFRQSGLMREKWDSPRNASTYGEDLIRKAMGVA